MHEDFVPSRKTIEIQRTPGRASEIGECVRRLDSGGVKDLLRDGVLQFVEYNTSGFLIWIPVTERFTYWKWAQPHLVQSDKPFLEDYPYNFYLIPYEWKIQSGERAIVFERVH